MAGLDWLDCVPQTNRERAMQDSLRGAALVVAAALAGALAGALLQRSRQASSSSGAPRAAGPGATSAGKRKVPVGVGVLIWRDASKSSILVGRRRKVHGGDLFALPGGWLHFGEAIEACAAREALEETGLHFGPSEIALPAIPPCNNLLLADNVHSVSVFAEAVLSGPSEPQNLEPEKCHEWRWVEPRAALALDLFPSLRHLLLHLLREDG